MHKEILLVEDNPDDVELTRLAFDEAKIANRLVVVGDGAEALDYLFARGRHEGRDPGDLPSIVLLDLNLPKVDGREVLQAVRANEARLVQVVLNLLVNAWQALGAGDPQRHEVGLRTLTDGRRALIELLYESGRRVSALELARFRHRSADRGAGRRPEGQPARARIDGQEKDLRFDNKRPMECRSKLQK